MSKFYRSREANVSAVNTKTALSTLASESAPGALNVPQGATKLVGLIACAAPDFAVAADGAYIVRIEGSGLKRGPEVFTIGASGVPVATGGNGAMQPIKYDLNIDVSAGDELLVFGEIVGEDTGTVNMLVTLVFATEAPAGLEPVRTLTLEGDLNAIDTRTQLTRQGSVTAPSRQVPTDVKKIASIIVASAADGLADGGGVLFLRFGGNAVLGGEQTICIGGHGCIAVQAGSDAAPNLGSILRLDNVDIEVRPGDVLNVEAEMAGVDMGDTAVAVTILFA